MTTKQILSWGGLIIGFLLLTGTLSANAVFKIIGLIMLIIALIFIVKDSK